MSKLGSWIVAIVALICICLVPVVISVGLGFLMQLVINPILIYFGIKTVSTILCTCFIWLLILIKFILFG